MRPGISLCRKGAQQILRRTYRLTIDKSRGFFVQFNWIIFSWMAGAVITKFEGVYAVMKIYMTEDYRTMSRKAANILSAQIILKPNSVLGLATGSSPVGMYHQLIEWYKKDDLDFSEIKTVNLDEYKGLNRENDQSYYYFMHDHLFNHVNIVRMYQCANANVFHWYIGILVNRYRDDI